MFLGKRRKKINECTQDCGSFTDCKVTITVSGRRLRDLARGEKRFECDSALAYHCTKRAFKLKDQ